jgi:hypothetical protein
MKKRRTLKSLKCRIFRALALAGYFLSMQIMAKRKKIENVEGRMAYS